MNEKIVQVLGQVVNLLRSDAVTFNLSGAELQGASNLVNALNQIGVNLSENTWIVSEVEQEVPDDLGDAA